MTHEERAAVRDAIEAMRIALANPHAAITTTSASQQSSRRIYDDAIHAIRDNPATTQQQPNVLGSRAHLGGQP
jgi:hypothetical protein